MSEPRDSLKTADDRAHDSGRVPLFGTWTAIYTAVAVSAVVVMVLVALFSRWPY